MTFARSGVERAPPARRFSHPCYSHENSGDTAPNLTFLTKLETGEPVGYEVEVEELRGCGQQLVQIGTDTADVKLGPGSAGQSDARQSENLRRLRPS